MAASISKRPMTPTFGTRSTGIPNSCQIEAFEDRRGYRNPRFLPPRAKFCAQATESPDSCPNQPSARKITPAALRFAADGAKGRRISAPLRAKPNSVLVPAIKAIAAQTATSRRSALGSPGTSPSRPAARLPPRRGTACNTARTRGAPCGTCRSRCRRAGACAG